MDSPKVIHFWGITTDPPSFEYRPIRLPKAGGSFHVAALRPTLQQRLAVCGQRVSGERGPIRRPPYHPAPWAIAGSQHYLLLHLRTRRALRGARARDGTAPR